ncbi:MAG: Rv0340 family protein [Mycobacterium sp.]|nr:Rv0340 family protein [Mycobacterium sp.]
MANALLDFVMSLVRDPDAAARYAADPAQAIADAALTDVTSVDVQNLIPVVAESLSMATPSHGLDALGVESASNVWASGAATSAFDAFADNVPESAVRDTYSVLTDIVDHSGVDRPEPGLDDLSSIDVLDAGEPLQLDEPVAHPVVESEDWIPPVADPDPGDHTPGLDIFD